MAKVLSPGTPEVSLALVTLQRWVLGQRYPDLEI